MNITLSIDERLVAEARKVARARGTSLNQMIRDELERVTSSQSGQELLQELEEQWGRGGAQSGGWRWNREELHDRSVLR
ncbi:MAG TPA: DUF6364 family protein [Thermoanaerobaculia bacterium]|nr:DUF6364 family protein [Thermoanaerobaculia bacterium]